MWLIVLLALFLAPPLLFFDVKNAVVVFATVFYFAILLLSYWVWEDGRKIELLKRELDLQKAKPKL